MSNIEVARPAAPALPNRLMTIQETADYLNVPMRWVQDAVQRRRIRCTRIGKHVRFTPEHVTELIAAGEQAVLSPAQVTRFQGRSSHRSRL